ncbi:MAG: hypothetical protein IJS47_02010 [Clostridia bacterium]|nr:hypothetical protein [Clostridia bacterium]MBQ9630634.1 hypothetical protein [Treponema sp.]
MKKVFECRTLQFAKTSDNHVRASMSPILGYTYYPHENHCYVAKTRYMCDVTHIVLEEHEGARRERTLKTNSQVPLLLNTKLFEEQTLEEGEVAFPEKDLCLVRFTIRNDENAEFILASMSVLAFSIATSFETFSSPYSIGEIIIINAIVEKDVADAFNELTYDYTTPEPSFDEEDEDDYENYSCAY